MWQELEPAWRAALTETWAAYLAGTHPIGAVVTDAAGTIVGRGRNRVYEPAGTTPAGPIGGHPLAHAELNALLQVDFTQADPHGCTLYATVEPCPLCLGALYMAGVRRLRFAARDAWAGSANLLGATPYLSRKPVWIHGPHSAIENTVLVLQTVFALARDGARAEALLTRTRLQHPQAVRVGSDPHTAERLRTWAAKGVLADVAMDGIAAMLGSALHSSAASARPQS